jgi:hypothetical protein
MFLTAIPTNESMIDNLPNDIKIKPTSATASSAQSGEGINLAFDDDYTTIYHSAWAGTTPPITLKFNFNEEDLDYLVYYPRADGGSNGVFGELDVYYTTTTVTTAIKLGEYDFGGSNSASAIRFPNTIEGVTTIEFRVKTGLTDSSNKFFASCAEMEFYREPADKFDASTIFTNSSCSKLKDGVTEADIKNITVEFYKKIASDLFYNTYKDKEFRIQTYKSYIDPLATANVLKLSHPYGKRDAPTGIYALKGDEIILLCEESTESVYPSLFIQKTDDRNNGNSFALKPGLNKVKAPFDGLMYVYYYSPTGTEKSIDIQIISGAVNGYFDIEKHDKEDWKRLIANATFSHFDMKGRYSLLNFETAAYRQYTKDKGPELLQAYDNLVKMEMEFMGLTKYNKEAPTRMHFQVVYGDNFMYATHYFTGYNDGTQKDVLNYDSLMSKTLTSGWAGGIGWGPAHEVGHMNQTTGMRWRGMTEVTNNIHSQYVTTTWYGLSRLYDEKLSGGTNRYAKAIAGIVKAQTPHNKGDGKTNGSDFFCKLVPFWQLKLYMHDVLDRTEFYADLYEAFRNTPTLTGGSNSNSVDGQYQLNFTKLVCQVSGYDFTEFFEDWGFYRPIDEMIDDYGTGRFIVTQAGADAVKSEIAALNLPKPPMPAGMKLYEIHDRNTASYKMP